MIRSFPKTALVALTATAIGMPALVDAQGLGGLLKKTQEIMSGAAGASKSAGASNSAGTVRSAAAPIDGRVLKGKWETDPAACAQPSDGYLLFDGGAGYSGWEFSCSIPANAYTTDGFRGAAKCAAEGEEFTSMVSVTLSADRQRLTMVSDNGQTIYHRCPRETEEILP